MREVTVTGLGLITPLGNEPDEFFANLRQGRSGISRLAIEGLEAQVGASVKGFDSSRWLTRLQLTGLDRVSQFAVAAASEALGDAALRLDDLDPLRVGVYIGCAFGGASTLDRGYRALYQRSRRIPALTVIGSMCNAPASQLSIRFGARGPVMTYSMACASATVAIGEAMLAIRRGEIDVALAGGCEAMLSYSTILAWESLGVLAQPDATDPASSCRPFSADRSGIVLGEGSAIFVLEECRHAERRGGLARAKVLGYGTASDASHISRPDSAGQVEAMKRALRDAGRMPADIGYINAHGTATQAGDIVETQAIKEVWGEAAYRLPVSSTKSMHGHLIGAAGAVELAATLMALERRIVPPTINLNVADPLCDLDYVPNCAREVDGLRFAATNSFAFGGSNATLIIGRADS